MADRQVIFCTIYERYLEQIFRFIYLKVNSQELAEDLAGEVFLRVWRHLGEDSIEYPQAFLYGIARNIVADYYRQGRKIFVVMQVEEMGESLEDDYSFEDQTLQNFEMDKVRQALSMLSEDYQNFIIWRYLEELSVPEIAQITGKAEENVRVGIHRAIRSLRGKLESEDPELLANSSSEQGVIESGILPT